MDGGKRNKGEVEGDLCWRKDESDLTGGLAAPR